MTINTNKLVLNQKLKENDSLITIVSVDDLLTEWSAKTRKSLDSVNRSKHVDIGSSADCPGCHDRAGLMAGSNSSNTTSSGGIASLDKVKALAGLVAPSIDSYTLSRMISEIGIRGQVVIKKINNKSYAIIGGFPGQRQLLTGTRYLATNPKIIDLAIGKLGVNRAIMSGARLTFALYVPINILTAVLDDQKTLMQFIGTTAADLVKIGISALVASAAAQGFAAMTTIAAGPFAIAILVGVLTAYALDELDRKYGITDSLVAKMEQITDEMIGQIARKWWEVEQYLRWQALNNQPVGQGIFY